MATQSLPVFYILLKYIPKVQSINVVFDAESLFPSNLHIIRIRLHHYRDQVNKGADAEQILPVIYSDNYFTLMPGEQKVVTIEWKAEDGRGQSPVIEVTPIN